MTDVRVDVAVVGAGLMGSATAWELTRRGVSVALLERFAPGHRHGSSHGTERIVRRAYADPFHVRLTGRALERWAQAQDDTGTPLLRTTGGLDTGRGRDPAGLARLLAGEGVPCELLTATEAQLRWPGMLFDGPVLFHPEAGVADADAAVAAWVRRVGERGGQVLAHTAVRAVEPVAVGALVHTDGPTVAAGTVVVAAGPWLPELAPALGLAEAALPPLRVTQQQVFHFRHRVPDAAWPTLVHKALPNGSGPNGSAPGGRALQLYGLPSGADGGTAPAFKVAEHDRGTPTTASTRDGVVDPRSRARIVDHVSRRLPGLHPAPVAEATCLYTTTPDDGFVLDRVGPVVVVSPCSGHGAKFAPLVGAMAADLALGGPPHARFALPARAAVPP